MDRGVLVKKLAALVLSTLLLPSVAAADSFTSALSGNLSSSLLGQLPSAGTGEELLTTVLSSQESLSQTLTKTGQKLALSEVLAEETAVAPLSAFKGGSGAGISSALKGPKVKDNGKGKDKGSKDKDKPHSVPEPASMLLFGTAAAVFAVRRRFTMRKQD